MTQHMAQFFGYFLIILGISLFLRVHFWLSWAKKMKAHPDQIIIFGILNVLLGLFVLTLHPGWSKDSDLVIIVLGWLMLVKGISFLWFPQLLFKLVPIEKYTPLFTRIQALLVIALGGFMVYYLK